MKPMNDNDPSRLAEYELPEWLQREQDEIREREAGDRIKVAIAVFAISFAGVLAMIQIARAGYWG